MNRCEMTSVRGAHLGVRGSIGKKKTADLSIRKQEFQNQKRGQRADQ